MERKENHTDKLTLEALEFEKLYFRYYPRLFNYSMQFTRDKGLSQDLVHEVYLKVWENISNIRTDSIEALLFKMTRNVCLNHIKHLKIVQNKHADLTMIRHWEELYRIEFLKDDPCLLIEKELEEKIQDVVTKLPDRCREVFELSRIKGLKNREIAEKMNISRKTVEKHISQAIKTFKNEISILAPVLLLILVLSQI